jgi:alkylated DNA nucleotide flippase Atl1
MPGPKVVWKSKTSWRAKLHKPVLPKLVPVPERMAKRLGSGMMLVPTALEVDAMIRKIPRGQVSSLSQIRRRLAHWHNADVTCPLVTGIFLRIVAEAAEEDRTAGKFDITPYWRVLREDGGLNTKFPGGSEAQARRLTEEGHTVVDGRVVALDHGRELPVKLRA